MMNIVEANRIVGEWLDRMPFEVEDVEAALIKVGGMIQIIRNANGIEVIITRNRRGQIHSGLVYGEVLVELAARMIEDGDIPALPREVIHAGQEVALDQEPKIVRGAAEEGLLQVERGGDF